MSSLQLSKIRKNTSEKGDFIHTLRQQWLSATDLQKRSVWYVSGVPEHRNTSWSKFIKQTGRLIETLTDLGARVHIVAASKDRDGKRFLQFHAVIFMPRSWSSYQIRGVLAGHKLSPCRKSGRPIRRVSGQCPIKLWCYVASHIDPTMKYKVKSHK